jgi:hypothetical protein
VRMQTDVRGRIRNIKLPVSRPLLPLFEAIVNAMQSIDSRPGRPRGTIEVRVHRDRTQLVLGIDDNLPPVSGFDIIDDGAGFNKTNFESFCTSDSTLKQEIGGKGVGRFSWLKAFDEVSIDSVFEDEDGTVCRRSFNFVATSEGIASHEFQPVKSEAPRTIIRLAGMKHPYQKYCKKRVSTIAFGIVRHMIVSYVYGRAPFISVSDEDGDACRCDSIWREQFREHDIDAIKIGAHDFTLTYLRCYKFKEDDEQTVFYCAHDREVTSTRVKEILSVAPPYMVDEEGNDFLLQTFVSSPYLDAHVSPERSEFDIPESKDLYSDDLTWSDIRQALREKLEEQCASYIETMRQQNRARVEEYISTTAPGYRHLLTLASNDIENLPVGLSEEKLDAELRKLEFGIESKHRQKAHELLAAKEADPEKLKKFVEEENELGKASLARYVAHRRYILELLAHSLGVQAEGEYVLEKAVHDLIFPLSSSSDEVPYERQNLWIIDERLSYHYYLASDKRFDSVQVLESDSQDRSDLLLFNKSFALGSDVESFESVVIVEFKRPMRAAYDKEDNPIPQVYSYVRTIREGKALDRSGRPIPWRDGMPFYCYIVADLTAKMRSFAEDASFTQTPDRQGYFGFNTNFGVYVEIISYTKLVQDAKKRNRILFDKLKII